MAGGKTDWFENLVLDYYIGKANATTAPGTLYLSLWNSTLNDSLNAATTGECAGANYARVAITNSSASWTNASAGSKQNKVAITFTTNASTGWGTIRAAALGDSTTGGNYFYWGDIAPQTISPGNTVQFSTGTIIISED